MGALTDNIFPVDVRYELNVKGYTGGYQGGKFIGSLLFWIVQRAIGQVLGDQDLPVIKYLISQGADCKVPLSFIKYGISSGQIGASDPDVKELLPMMQSCAK